VWVEAEADGRRVKAEAGGRGSRLRRATTSGSDGEDGTVGLREGERILEISQECSNGGVPRILQLPLRELLEAAQCVLLPHCTLVGRDGEVAGVGLRGCLVPCAELNQTACRVHLFAFLLHLASQVGRTQKASLGLAPKKCGNRPFLASQASDMQH
jgi:hypothetical protein